MIVYLGLGSNLGDRLGYLLGALAGLHELTGSLPLPSAVYESVPVGGPDDQPQYLNLVVRQDSDLSPLELLEVAHELERRAERVRTVRFGPRTLDVDVLLYDDLSLDEPDLVVPRPRMCERAFVLAPLEDLDPGRVPPGWRDALGGAAAVAAAVRRVAVIERAASGEGWRAWPIGDAAIAG